MSYLLTGEALLVKPVTDAGTSSVSVYLPGEHSVSIECWEGRGYGGPVKGKVYRDVPL